MAIMILGSIAFTVVAFFLFWQLLNLAGQSDSLFKAIARNISERKNVWRMNPEERAAWDVVKRLEREERDCYRLSQRYFNKGDSKMGDKFYQKSLELEKERLKAVDEYLGVRYNQGRDDWTGGTL